MAQVIEKPNIFNSTNYREFLVEHLAFLKAQFGREYSLRQISARSELSPGYLPQVLGGSIPLSEKAMSRLVPHLKLTPAEASCLSYMRIVSEAELQKDRVAAFKKIQRFREFADSKESKVFNYLSHWYYVVIREMTFLKDFKLDPKWIQSRLRKKLPLKDIKKAIEFLVENGFVEKLPEGKAKSASEKTISCHDGIFRLSMSQYHREMLELIGESISTVERSQRKLRVYTVAVDDDDFQEVQNILDEALDKIIEIGKKKKQSKDIYSVHVSAVPLTQIEGKEQ